MLNKTQKEALRKQKQYKRQAAQANLLNEAWDSNLEEDPTNEMDAGAKMYGSKSERLQDQLWQDLEKVVKRFVTQHGYRLNLKRQNNLFANVEDAIGEVSRQVMRGIDPSYDPDNLEDIGLDDD